MWHNADVRPRSLPTAARCTTEKEQQKDLCDVDLSWLCQMATCFDRARVAAQDGPSVMDEATVVSEEFDTDLTNEQRQDIREVYDMFMHEEFNGVPMRELQVAMGALGLAPNTEEIDLMVSRGKSDGAIGFPAFSQMMKNKFLRRDPRDQILKAFRLFDHDETGNISFHNLRHVAKELGERMTDDEIKDLLQTADLDGDGEVNEADFCRIMQAATSS
uniref:EF-hand domain-containing protein n=1 Tax=Noctiluca scintillans TaxID=2966 RepID=A0A7S1F4C4_NOCSC|mmetsp:Transcript_31355/g.83403  ORF Transcript_31355/g.83403 Transcript_31355/m.83403 type:complete len:217 (+) Transcript_31355:122-772(+)